MGGFYGAVLEMVPLHLVATPIYMQGRLGNVVHLCVQRRGHGFGDTLCHKNPHIYLKDCDKD